MNDSFHNTTKKERALHPGIYELWEKNTDVIDSISTGSQEMLIHIEILCEIFNREKIHPKPIDPSLHKKAFVEIHTHQKIISLFPNFSESPHSDFYEWLFLQAELASQELKTDYFHKLALKLYRCKTLQRRTDPLHGFTNE